MEGECLAKQINERTEYMKKLSKILNYIVFAAATFAIAGVFYEGMALKWYSITKIFILIMDYSFLVSTLINIAVYRKTKWIYINIFSLIFIILAYILKFLEISYPIIGLVFWYFYIWFLYGVQITNKMKR
jgi:hypothetical protein